MSPLLTRPLLLLGFLALWPACRPATPPAPPSTIRWPVMSTIAELSLPASAATNSTLLQPLVAETFDTVEHTLSLFRPESDLVRVNRSGGTHGPAVIGDMTAEVLAYALRIARESDGAFDPTVSPLMVCWGLRGGNTPPALPPGEAEIRAALQRVGWRHLQLSPRASAEEAPTLRMDAPGMQLDLGGIAKGYAVDLAYQTLRKRGATDFLINLAGNMRGHGRPEASRSGWRVGIRNPFESEAWLGTLLLADGEGIATSGSYERYIVIRDRRHGHILDPRTGQPVAGMISVTVVAPSAMEADALSTALFVLGAEQRHALLLSHAGCEAIFLPDTQPRRLQVTRGLRSRFHPAPDWQATVEWL
jgi:FAD:protein FMN transferase